MFSSWTSVRREFCLFFRNFLGYGVGKLCLSLYLELYNLRLGEGVIGIIRRKMLCGMLKWKMEFRDNVDFEYLTNADGEISKGTFNFCLWKI